jgi:fluoride exporter
VNGVNGLHVLYVALGGALGSVARYLVGIAVHRYTAAGFPYGTFTVNIVGCAAFGLIVGFAEPRVALTPALRAFFLVGVLGGFTTFSAFTFDTLELLRAAAFLRAAFNVIGQITFGLAALWLGYAVAKLV